MMKTNLFTWRVNQKSRQKMFWIKTDSKVFDLLWEQDFYPGKNSKQESRLIIKAGGLIDQRLLFCPNLGWNTRFLISVFCCTWSTLCFFGISTCIYCRILESHTAQSLQELFGSSTASSVLPLCSFSDFCKVPKKILGSRISLSTAEVFLSLEYFEFFLYYRHYSLKPSQKWEKLIWLQVERLWWLPRCPAPTFALRGPHRFPLMSSRTLRHMQWEEGWLVAFVLEEIR